MSVTGAERRPDGSTYIRAGGGVPVSGRRLGGVLVWLVVAVLFGVAAYMALLAAGRDSRMALLRHHGVPVDVVVSGCRGISSGVGMGIEYWQCSGSFTLAGRGYEEVIGGSRALLERGQHVGGVVVPGRPGSLATAASVRRAGGSGAEYAAAAGLAVAGLLVAAARVVVVRRRPKGLEPPGGR
jgi:hypothetical protein